MKMSKSEYQFFIVGSKKATTFMKNVTDPNFTADLEPNLSIMLEVKELENPKNKLVTASDLA
ncbi:UNKNOWN [Stylonychia lemnae]|uniref:Uncharacterized protein n=1 Tax=Stylonychia lemnae TaxID=5949 RepID=A0A078A8T0_STYLE|nr:UNKNOWN [Stylonychia lemnae]|eukprot:CDW77196.1 UNKNOWN [Stylonychia lemnae]